MKNNKALIIIGVVLLNILVVFMIGQSLMGKTSQYEKLLTEARSLAEQELCSKAIAKYNEVVMTKDTLDVRLEMIDVYKKGIAIGEFTNTYDVMTAVTTIVDTFRQEPRAYESACELFLEYNKHEECAKVLMKARNLHVTSEKIEEYRGQVRYQYMKFFAMYTEVLPVFNGMYTVKTGNGYTFLNDEGSANFDGTFIEASSFSEGYAFVKNVYLDGTDRSFIINKDGERQAYLNGVETSSGIGRAKDADGKDVLLLACKIGDKYKYFDVNGKEIFGDYAFAGRFRNNVAAVMVSEGNWKLINGAGNPITDTTFSDVVLNEFDECAAKGYIIAKTGNKYHIYSLKAEQIGDFGCDGARAFVDEYAAFRSGELWGFVDTQGTVIIQPQYEDAKSFSNSMGAVKISDGWVFINPKNEIVIQETFEDVDYLNDKGICFVKSDDYWSYLKMYYTGK